MGWGDGEGAVLVHQDHGPTKTFVNHREIIFDPPPTPVFSSYCFFQWGMDSYQQYEAQWEVTSLKTLWPVKLSVDKHGYPWHSSHPVSLGEYFPRVNASCTDMTVQWVWDCFSICVTDRYRKYFPKAFHYLIANSASHPSPDCNLHSWYLLI